MQALALERPKGTTANAAAAFPLVCACLRALCSTEVCDARCDPLSTSCASIGCGDALRRPMSWKVSWLLAKQGDTVATNPAHDYRGQGCTNFTAKSGGQTSKANLCRAKVR